jgi:hypothetical protein
VPIKKITHRRKRPKRKQMKKKEQLCSMVLTRPLKALKKGNDGYKVVMTGHKYVYIILNGKSYRKSRHTGVQGKNHTDDLVIKLHLCNHSSTPLVD